MGYSHPVSPYASCLMDGLAKGRAVLLSPRPSSVSDMLMDQHSCTLKLYKKKFTKLATHFKK